MELFETTLALLFMAALAVAFAPKIKLPVELVLLLGSIVITAVSGVDSIVLDPDVVFFILLPPILSSAAYFTSWRDFKKNWRSISLLAIGLVIFTVISVGYIVHWLVPEIPLQVGFLLGAIISPPDASAATAIAKQVGMPQRLLTILEGESLVNDATALVCFRFAIAAIASGTFHLPTAIGQFFLVALGGCLVGFAVAILFLYTIKHLRNGSAEALVSLLSCFFAYLIAEKLHVSGVIATVTTGLYFGRRLPQITNAEMRFEARGTWNVALLGINGIVFALIGMQLPTVIDGLSAYSSFELFSLLAAVIVTLVGSRFAWIFLSTRAIYWILNYLRLEHEPMPSWKALSLLSWTGMRGIVSLAAALAIPSALPNGDPFPHRDLLIFLTYGVIIVTLVLPSLTLPMITKEMNIPHNDTDSLEQVVARLSMAEAALDKLKEQAAGHESIDIAMVQDRYERLRNRLEPNLEKTAFTYLDRSEQNLRMLSGELIIAERQRLIDIRCQGKLNEETFHELARELDLEEMRIQKNARPL